tara:strand:+ start:2312 stop:2494 length:183 start_codon:yes stop_codon:yes gene_type:complete
VAPFRREVLLEFGEVFFLIDHTDHCPLRSSGGRGGPFSGSLLWGTPLRRKVLPGIRAEFS